MMALEVRTSWLAIALLTGLSGCGDATDPTASQTNSKPAQSETPEFSEHWFTDVSGDCGLDFVHFAGLTGRYYYPEILAPGCALFDYDNDGDLDVYITQGRVLEPGKSAPDAISDAPLADTDLGNRLYRNEIISESGSKGELRFTDVTEESGTGIRSYGMGATCADFNGDGHLDLFLTNFGPDALLLNNGDGTFRDASAESGLADPRWTTAAAPIDFDLDGDLDVDEPATRDFRLTRTVPREVDHPSTPDTGLDGSPANGAINDMGAFETPQTLPVR